MKRKAVIIGLMTLAVASAIGATSFDRANALKEELKLNHVDGNKEAATRLATKLAQASGTEPFIQGALQEELRGLDTPVMNKNFEQAVKFVTGTKTEFYCAGQGLVEMSGEHDDGSTSHLVLTRSNRKMVNNSYSQIEAGDWAYELTNSYRRPTLSELWLVTSSPSSYHVKESRSKSDGKSDTAEYAASWSKNHQTNSFGSQGGGPEPLPVYMAIDFHVWGNTDMGYRIKFEPGATDSRFTGVHGAAREIELNSERTVGELLLTHKVKDSQGVEREYKNCFPVRYKITLHKLSERQLTVEGKINKDGIRRTIKKGRDQALACYRTAKEVDPTLHGTVTLGWELGDDGVPENVRSVSRSLVGNEKYPVRDEMIQCLIERVKTWKFPPAAEGQTARVTYPFKFNK